MSSEVDAATPETAQVPDSRRAALDLFLISLLILFLELACIRWFPAHVLYLTFFTNTVLLASFLGMSLGCLAVSQERNYLAWTPYVLAFAMGVAALVSVKHRELIRYLDVGNQDAPQLVFFGTEGYVKDPTRTPVPIELIAGFFFLFITLAFVGPGQVLGRALGRLPNRIHAYSLNILGSLVGIVLFAGLSWLQTPPPVWFIPVVLGIGYFLYSSPALGQRGSWLAGAALAVVLVFSTITLLTEHLGNRIIEHSWSPYYRIDYDTPDSHFSRFIQVNLIGHQQMVSTKQIFPAYALPHLLNRDAKGPPFKDVLIIGAGSGNDVSRALQWGAEYIDAVDIDPRIQALGERDHPDDPYERNKPVNDKRVHVTITDGRNFLKAGDKQYDLVIFALVDSLVLHSGYSNIRLESFLFTQQALADVKKRLKPGGLFIMYNYFRQGWIVARLKKGLTETFGTEPLVLTLPYRAKVDPGSFDGFTIFIAGQEDNLAYLRKSFRDDAGTYDRLFCLNALEAAGPQSPNGFTVPGPEERQAMQLKPSEPAWRAMGSLVGAAGAFPVQQTWHWFGLASVETPPGELRTATDDWPFLYLREPMIPLQPSLSGMGVMAAIALVLILLFLPRSSKQGKRLSFDGRMFFLGAGFMLIETKAVVNMALLFGSTWMVNSVVFFAVLVMILLANLFVLKVQPAKTWPYYVGLAVALALNAGISLDVFLGWDRSMQIIAACALVFAPILFAGVIFAISFNRTSEPDQAFGANIAGAMAGGLAENASMILGFQYLMFVALAFYGLSWLTGLVRQASPAVDAALAPPP